MTSQVGLAPLTIDRMPAGRKKPSMFARRRPCRLQALRPGQARTAPIRRGRVQGQAGFIARVWRRQLGGVQKVFRKLNQAAYLVSIPFLMILLFGTVIGNRPMALFGATVVVLLNIGRLVAGTANLAIIPLRDGINFEKMKKPLGRVIEPAVTIGLVVLAFTFIPWLSSGQAAKGSIADRIRSGPRPSRRT